MRKIVLNFNDAVDLIRIIDKSLLTDRRLEPVQKRITDLIRFRIADSFAKDTDPVYASSLEKRRVSKAKQRQLKKENK